jgi:hypothetical protein
MWPFRKKPKPIPIPPYAPPVREVKTEKGIEVTEHDTTEMSQTGIHRAWKRMTGKDDKGD